jgi:dihydrofolate reductase
MPSNLVVRCFSVSADGYGAGPDQDVNNPMGVGGMALHEWVLPTRFFQKKLFNKDGGTTGPDNDFAVRGFENIGAWILGRNMFGPVRGRWPDDSWKGWWGDEPPYHCDVFVLTHHARPPLEMKGGGNICTRALSTSSILRFRLSCSDRAKACLRTSTCRVSATSRPSMSQPPTRCTWSSAEAPEAA